jgi:1-acyl-sn-glycerol-3-phosphate acyltransferase
VIGNHIASADPPILGGKFPRPLHFMAKIEWFKSPVAGFLARQFLCFPVVRHTADRAALRYTLQLLEQGQAVCIYPEGTRAEDARIHPVEAGVGFVARRSGVPILPVAVWGTEKVLPARGTHWPRAADCYLRYGKPFQLPRPDMSNQEAADYMMSKVAAMLPSAYRGVFESSEAMPESRVIA